MITVHRAVDPQLVEDGNHLLPLGEGADWEQRTLSHDIQDLGLLTDTRGEDVSREEDDGIAVLADSLDGRQEPGGASNWLHPSAVHVVDVVEVEESDGVRSCYWHLVSRLAKGTLTGDTRLRLELSSAVIG